ncbi:hypothetical protein EDI29_21530 [Pectobacterium polonicum]|uniref:deaminase domain-containing protein n=1 Tax=Pectobacterium polonicum TaxID=2485124 RepID=UPI0010F8A374|nr:hypothetical protein EDI29_21530 [Pectobacterium polonicum]
MTSLFTIRCKCHLSKEFVQTVTKLNNNTAFTEKPVCDSFLGVIEQFQKKYPGIKVDVLDNNGVRLTPRRRN